MSLTDIVTGISEEAQIMADSRENSRPLDVDVEGNPGSVFYEKAMLAEQSSKRDWATYYNVDFFEPMVRTRYNLSSANVYDRRPHILNNYIKKGVGQNEIEVFVYDPLKNLTEEQVAEAIGVFLKNELSNEEILLIYIDKVEVQSSTVELPNGVAVDMSRWSILIKYGDRGL